MRNADRSRGGRGQRGVLCLIQLPRSKENALNLVVVRVKIMLKLNV